MGGTEGRGAVTSALMQRLEEHQRLRRAQRIKGAPGAAQGAGQGLTELHGLRLHGSSAPALQY